MKKKKKQKKGKSEKYENDYNRVGQGNENLCFIIIGTEV